MRWLSNLFQRFAPKLKDSAPTRGQWAESLAERYLRSQGLRLWQRNYRIRGGECDLLMQDGNALVFVEVRYRRGEEYGKAVESITAIKRRRILLCANHYLSSHPAAHQCACRFDVVVISGDSQKPRIEWLKDAFRP